MELFYREYGDGFPMLILHGLYGSSDNWVSIAKKLSDTYRVILPDQRNHGRSAHETLHTYPAMSKDLYELVSKLGIDKFILVGHSMGGKTASFFARQWPDLLAGLVIIDISPFRSGPAYSFSDSMHGRVLKRMAETDPSGFEDREEAAALFNDITSSGKVRNFLLKNLQRNKKGGFEWKHNPHNLYNNLENIFDGIELPEKGETQTVRGFPVFFLRAMESDYISESDYEPIQKVFPAAEIVEIPGSSHWIHAEKPEIIIKLLREHFPA
ncbi:MAG: alpha/beta fold hydrolase [Bacteroidales bacterium]|nr:alpha/beta fold hydrolase [Bacteroidales bacterium]